MTWPTLYWHSCISLKRSLYDKAWSVMHIKLTCLTIKLWTLAIRSNTLIRWWYWAILAKFVGVLLSTATKWVYVGSCSPRQSMIWSLTKQNVSIFGLIKSQKNQNIYTSWFGFSPAWAYFLHLVGLIYTPCPDCITQQLLTAKKLSDYNWQAFRTNMMSMKATGLLSLHAKQWTLPPTTYLSRCQPPA